MRSVKTIPVLFSALTFVACGGGGSDSPPSAAADIAVETDGAQATPSEGSPQAGAGQGSGEGESSGPDTGGDAEGASPDLDLEAGGAGAAESAGSMSGDAESAMGAEPVMAEDGAAQEDAPAEDAPMEDAAEEEPAEPAADATARAELSVTTAAPGAWQNFSGTATWTQLGEEVTVVVEVAGCPDGPHISHIHANPECGADGEAAGLHWVPNGEVFSDMTCSDGVASMTHTESTEVWTIGGDPSTDVTLHAYMIHVLDDAQGGGVRAACGAIVQQ